jgi:type IV secretion system protein TrbL
MIDSVKPFSNRLLYLLLGLDVVFMGINIAMGKLASIEKIVERLLFMGFVIYIVNNFTGLAYMFKNSFITILGQTGGLNQTIYDDPSQIMNWAHANLIAPMNEAIRRVDQAYTPPAFNVLQAGQWLATSFGHMEDVWSVRLIFNLVHMGIQLAFIIIAVEMTIARIEFYLIVLFALVLVPFIAWGPLRFIGSRAFSAVIAQALKLGIIVAIVSLGMHVMTSLNSTILNQMNPTNIDGSIDFSVVGLVLASCAVLVFLSIQVPALAMALISGSPGLSASGFAGNMMGITAIGMAAVNGFRSMGQAVRSATSSSSGGGSGLPSPTYATQPATASAAISSAPTSGGATLPPAQTLFQPAPGSPPSAPRSGSGAVAAKVNPVTETGTGAAHTATPDRMFQPVASSSPGSSQGTT